MTVGETNEISGVVQRVQSWPVPMRIALARRILQTVEDVGASEPPTTRPPGYSAAEIKSMLTIDKPAPDDATVKQWIEEHRLEKYGT